MLYRVLADAVLALHFCFILFVVLGWLPALRWRWIVLPHLIAAAWGALIMFGGWICPLTPLENHFRRLGGESGYSDSFIERYLLPIIYPGALTREIQLVLGCAVVAINVAAYAWTWRRSRKPRKQQP